MRRFTAITTLAVALLSAAPSAQAHRRDRQERHERRDHRHEARLDREPKIKVLPFRVEARTTLRERTTPGFVPAFSVQPWQSEHFLVETAVAIPLASALGYVGPLRTRGSVDLTVEPAVKLGPMFTTGPTAGASYRFYRQQGTGVQEHWSGIFGWRANVALIRARTWGLEITGRLALDTVKTELVLATSEVATLSPVEGQIGLRFVFGYGRSK